MDRIEALIADLWGSGHTFDAPPATIDEWCSTLQCSVPDFYDITGMLLARAYHEGRLSYEYCDDAANALWGSLVLREKLDPFPKVFYQVYEAFDAGEYAHGENPDADPVETYTRPLIAKLVAE